MNKSVLMLQEQRAFLIVFSFVIVHFSLRVFFKNQNEATILLLLIIQQSKLIHKDFIWPGVMNELTKNQAKS